MSYFDNLRAEIQRLDHSIAIEKNTNIKLAYIDKDIRKSEDYIAFLKNYTKRKVVTLVFTFIFQIPLYIIIPQIIVASSRIRIAKERIVKLHVLKRKLKSEQLKEQTRASSEPVKKVSTKKENVLSKEEILVKEAEKAAMKLEAERIEREIAARKAFAERFATSLLHHSLKKAKLEEIDSYLQVIGGVHYYVFDGFALVGGCDKNLKNITISNCITIKGEEVPVTGIMDSSFKNNSELKSIMLPDTIEIIGEYAFLGCFQLKEVNIPDSVVSIGNNAFDSCLSLRKASLSRNTVLENNVFLMCNACEFTYH